MNRTLLIKTTFFILTFSFTAAHAQTPSEKKVSDLSTEKITDEKPLPANIPLKFFNRTFNAGNADAESINNSVRQQAYIRPTKEERYVSDAFGVPALIGATFGAAFNQISNSPPEWRRTAGGFGKRYASSYGTNAIRNTVSFGLSEAFRLDNRFEKSGQKNFGKRLKHVFIGSYTTHTKTGNRIPDFPFAAGTYTASIIANEVWYPKRYGFQDGLRDGTISLGVRFGVNLLREFILPK